MEPSELLARMADSFEQLGISYRVTGSMATIAYGEARFTNDIDVVARISPAQVDDLCAAFPAPEFYLSRDAATHAVRDRFQFNIIQPGSGLKVDVIVASDSPFDRSRFGRGRRILIDDEREVWFASPEDVILKKLLYFREGGSEKHLRDIVGVLKVQGETIDRDYLNEWVASLEVEEEWQLALSRMPSPS